MVENDFHGNLTTIIIPLPTYVISNMFNITDLKKILLHNPINLNPKRK